MKDSEDYYLREGCPEFALALKDIFGYTLKAVVIPSKKENYGGSEDYPLYAHIYAYDYEKYKAIDVTGVCDEQEINERYADIVNNRYELNLISICEKDLRNLMGTGKPFYNFSKEKFEEAKRIIKNNIKKYKISD